MKAALFAIALCFVTINGSAQILNVEDYNAPIYSYILNIGKAPDDEFFIRYLNRECLAFFLDTAGKGNVKFSSVIAYDYRAKDSVHHKKLRYKCMMRFNEAGQMVYQYVTNKRGKVIDSERMTYNSAHKLLSDLQYNIDSFKSKRKVINTMADYRSYDRNNREIKDSAWDYWAIYRIGHPGIYKEYKTYNDVGNLLTDSVVASPENPGEDTEVDYTIHKYDSIRKDTLSDKYNLRELVMPAIQGKTHSDTIFIAYYSPDSKGKYFPVREREVWARNQKNKLVSYVLYDSSINGRNPYETDNYVYYPDNVSLKKHTYTDYNNSTHHYEYCIGFFGEDSRILKYICPDDYGYREIDYEYKK